MYLSKKKILILSGSGRGADRAPDAPNTNLPEFSIYRLNKCAELAWPCQLRPELASCWLAPLEIRQPWLLFAEPRWMPRQRKTARQKPAQLQRRASASWTGGDASSKLKPPHIVAIVLSIASVAAVLFTARRTLGLDSGAGGALEDDVLPLPPFSTESRDVDPAERLARARSLLAAAVDAGAVMHVPLTIEFTGDPAAGELGLYVQDDVAAAGLPVLTLPAALMLRSAGSASDEGSSASTDENGPAGAAGLAAALLRERRRPRSKLSRLWLESLPSACPANLAARQAADAELAAVSLHAWKVGLMRAAEAEMAANLPDSSAQEREWAMCMVLSRALLHGGGSALEPVVDLINHGTAVPSSAIPSLALYASLRSMLVCDR
eukprot:SAG31_NODE_477_length_15150_cov_13.611772_13_plen_379_part_00